uniref:zinc finger domain-containing protein n=1 Tax=Peterkaempfera griseoplana TaxID=66896 RepID=UPI000A9209F0
APTPARDTLYTYAGTPAVLPESLLDAKLDAYRDEILREEAEPLRAAVAEALALFDAGPLAVRCSACGAEPGNLCYGNGPMTEPHQARYRIQQTTALGLLRTAVTR